MLLEQKAAVSPWKIEDCMNINTTKYQKMKHKIVHPYDYPDNFNNIEVKVEGETLKDVPHGLCFIKFVYNGEFDGIDYKKPLTSSKDIYQDNQKQTFRGLGTFNLGVLSNGPCIL